MTELIPIYSFNPVQKDYTIIKASAAVPEKIIERQSNDKVQINQAFEEKIHERAVFNRGINAIESNNLAEASQIQEANRVYNQIKIMKDSFNNFNRD